MEGLKRFIKLCEYNPEDLKPHEISKLFQVYFPERFHGWNRLESQWKVRKFFTIRYGLGDDVVKVNLPDSWNAHPISESEIRAIFAEVQAKLIELLAARS